MGGGEFWTLVAEAAGQRPGSVLVADGHGRSLTATAFRDEAERAAAGLLALRVGPGDVVSWQLPTTLEAAVLLGACARLGVVQNPIIPVFRHREVGFIVEQVRSRLLVVPERWRGFGHGDMARSLRPDVLALDLESPPGAAIRLPAGDPAALPPPPGNPAALPPPPGNPAALPPPPGNPAALPVPPGDAAAPAPPPDECRWIYYSSGTTADPKGARHTDASVIASSAGMVDYLGLGAGDVYPIAWPFAHIGGVCMLSAVLRAGGTLALFDTFDPVTTPERMAAHRPTILGSATPFFHAYIAAQRRHGDRRLFPALRACVGGGAATPDTVSREVAAVLGVRGVVGAWGLTEFPVASSETPDDPEVGSTVGRPAAGVQVRVVGGELRLKGPQCFLGYVDASLDADAFDDAGWFRTGDLGTVDAGGRIRIEGRSKDIIVRNAENVSALEVEDALLRHPAVADVAVIGVRDEDSGERVCAVVVAAPGHEITLTELVEHCRAQGLARYKCPERLRVVDELPRNPMGKVLKRALQAAPQP
jgi:cyclohexanecarboxylate-CoA ligase